MGCFPSKSVPSPTVGQVICETSDKHHVAVDLAVLRISGTFDRMYRDLGLQENETFLGVFPVKTIDSRVFNKVVHWCNKLEDQSFTLEKDPFTQECIWFQFSKSDRRFFRVPVEELLELVMAALYLDIPSLEHYACQAIAALVKDKQPVDVRRILRQQDDLSPGEYVDIQDWNPWLDPETVVRDPVASTSDTLYFPSEVLVTVFEKLSRADLERLQLVNAQFRDIIWTVGKLGEEHGPLRLVPMVQIRYASTDCHVIYPGGGAHILCWDHSTLVRRLKFCAIDLLTALDKCSDQLLHQLLPSKLSWKKATVHTTTSTFSSEEAFTFAFRDLFLCKKIRLEEAIQASFVPISVLRLPAMIQCNELDIAHLPPFMNLGGQLYSIKVRDIVDWLEREGRKKWDEPSRLTIAGHAISGGPHELTEALKKVFLAASRPNPYIVRIRMFHAVDVDEEFHENKTTHEKLHVHNDGNDYSCVLVERK